jgi:hypothetical protein
MFFAHAYKHQVPSSCAATRTHTQGRRAEGSIKRSRSASRAAGRLEGASGALLRRERRAVPPVRSAPRERASCTDGQGKVKGLLWDLEYLVDDNGRRVAAFGRPAGLVGECLARCVWGTAADVCPPVRSGMALGLLQWAHRQLVRDTVAAVTTVR